MTSKQRCSVGRPRGTSGRDGANPGLPVHDDSPGFPVHDDNPGLPVHDDNPGLPVHDDNRGLPVQDFTGLQRNDRKLILLLSAIKAMCTLVLFITHNASVIIIFIILFFFT